MVGFLKKLERTDVPFLQAAETLYGQGGKVHVHPANAAAILFRTVPYIIMSLPGYASPATMSTRLCPCRSRIFVSCLISSGFNARRIASLFGSSECAVQALNGTEVGDVQRSKKDNPVSVDLFLHGFGRMKQFVQ